MSDERFIEQEVEVVGTPEQVWEAIATGPGISSWYVPHTVEEKEGGAATASFGAGPEMQVAGRVAAWDPPNRVVFDGGEGVEGMAFEWLVEARDGGTCIVRLVNTGFSGGEEWDDQYDAMTDGWKMFLFNLQLHLQHFGGQTATAMLPLASWPGPAETAWVALTTALEVPTRPKLGDRVEIDRANTPKLAGTIVEVGPTRVSLLLDSPAPGTAFIAAEGRGDQAEISIWSYLYGVEGATAAARDEPGWVKWLADNSPAK
ncbi:MAG: SRPBCC domain-containing protein [Acidimicrobiales bacterium]